MNTASEQNAIYGTLRTAVDTQQLSASAVSWGAIFAGAAAAAALSLILLILGTGLGLSSISPWAHDGVSATTFGVTTIIWITLTQLLAAGMGGYLAGRLRTKWIELHTDEVFFRDTAHGFLAWAIASLATATLLTSVIGAIVSGGVQAALRWPVGLPRPPSWRLPAVYRQARKWPLTRLTVARLATSSTPCFAAT